MNWLERHFGPWMFGLLICAGALAGGLLLGRILPPNADTVLTDAVSNQTLDSALDCIKNAARRQDFMRKGDALQVTCVGDPARALFDSVVGSNEISEGVTSALLGQNGSGCWHRKPKDLYNCNLVIDLSQLQHR
jgi:hypothetical protein